MVEAKAPPASLLPPLQRGTMRQLIGAALAIPLLLAAMASRAEWLEAQTPHMTVYSDGTARQLREAAARLEDYDGLLRAVTRTPPTADTDRLAVYLVRSSSDLVTAGGPNRRDVAGFYAARLGGIAAVALRGNTGRLTGEETVQHEYAHHFMMRYFPAYYPPWYVEGFAEYLMTARFTPERIEVGLASAERIERLINHHWLPLDTVLTANPSQLADDQRLAFYAESWLFVHYLLESEARAAMLAGYLDALGKGTPEAVAFQTAFAMAPATMQRELFSYVNGRMHYGVMNRLPRYSPDSVAIRQLPDAADDLLLPRLALMLSYQGKPAPLAETLAAVRKAAARHSGDPFAQRVLARAEIEAGDRDAGAALAEALLATAPDDTELLFLRGLADFNAGGADPQAWAARSASARGWFARAVKADSNNYTAHYFLAITLPDSHDAALIELLTARSLAPQVAAIALTAAGKLINKQRQAEARTLLQPIAADPHGGPAAERARKMIEGMTAKASDGGAKPVAE